MYSVNTRERIQYIWKPEYEFNLERSRAPSGAFTSPDGGVYEVHELEQLPSGTYGTTIRLILHCIRTFRTGFEPGSSRIKYRIKEYSLLMGFSKSNTSRTRFET